MRRRRDSPILWLVLFHLASLVWKSLSNLTRKQSSLLAHLRSFSLRFKTAEAERFELSMPCDMLPFQGSGINHYPTPPSALILYYLS